MKCLVIVTLFVFMGSLSAYMAGDVVSSFDLPYECTPGNTHITGVTHRNGRIYLSCFDLGT